MLIGFSFKCFYTHINEEKYDFQKILLKLLRKDRIENKDLIENEKRELCTHIRQKVSNESFWFLELLIHVKVWGWFHQYNISNLKFIVNGSLSTRKIKIRFFISYNRGKLKI